MRKVFDFHGGIHPPENKTQSTSSAIGSIPLAKQLVIALNQHIGAPATPLVSTGDYVKKGQLIAEAQGAVSVNLHAPASGMISAVEDRITNHPSGMSFKSIVIDTDGEDTWTKLEPCERPFELGPIELIQKIAAAGIAGMGGAGFPTAVKLSPSKSTAAKPNANTIDTLILNAAECEPYITADDMLIRERSDDILQGALLLGKTISGITSILIGIEDNKAEAIAALEKAIAKIDSTEAKVLDAKIEIVIVPTKYPSGGEKQLIKLLTGKEVPAGKIPAHIGIVMQNVATAFSVWRAVRYGEPLISRVTTIAGKALKSEKNIELPIGTPINHILQQHGFDESKGERVIVGGPMMGYTLRDTSAPIIKTTNCILAPSREELAIPSPAQACIRCGMCAEACPAELLPQQLYWYARAEDVDKLQAYNLFDCIECGACSYVCPSNIPLVQYYRAAKGKIKLAQQEKIISDNARLRFEARQQRIDKAAAEKEAKRAARKKATEAARQKQSKPTDSSTVQASTPSLVQQAVTAAQNTSADTEKEKAKLMRGLSSAENRLDRANQALQKHKNEGAEASRIEALMARVKQAEQNVHEAQKKLDDAGL